MRDNLSGVGSVVPQFYASPIGIRFELSGIGGTYSDELGRCRTDRELAPIIQQATTRAIALFEAAFPESDEGWYLARTGFAQTWREHVGRFRQPSKRQAIKALTSLLPKSEGGAHTLSVETIADWRWDQEGPAPRILEAISPIQMRSINYREILGRLAGAELGGRVDVWESHFVSGVSGIVFHTYYDQGLDIIAPDADAIRAIYSRFSDWILDYDRDRIDAVFA